MSSPASFRKLRDDVWSLFGEIDSNSVQDLYQAIVTTPPQLEPLLLLHSEGGDVVLTLGLLHSLKKFPRLETRVVGEVASAGVHLLQAGTLRTALPSATFFTHPIRWGPDVSPDSAPSALAQFERDQTRWVEALVHRTRRPARFWRRFLSQDHHFDAAEALELGLIDEIV